MHRCSNSSSLSLFFPMATKQQQQASDHEAVVDTNHTVDCTLSLGTPSTRQTTDGSDYSTKPSPSRPHGSCMPTWCTWDIMSHHQTTNKLARANNNNNNLHSCGDPTLLARRCANCDTTSTPLWRNGPRGPKSLCNACGIRYKKEERRAATTASPAVSPSPDQVMGYNYRQQQQQQQQQQSTWGCYRGGDVEEDGGSYLSWHLNVVPPAQFPVRDRPTLFQYQ